MNTEKETAIPSAARLSRLDHEPADLLGVQIEDCSALEIGRKELDDHVQGN